MRNVVVNQKDDHYGLCLERWFADDENCDFSTCSRWVQRRISWKSWRWSDLLGQQLLGVGHKFTRTRRCESAEGFPSWSFVSFVVKALPSLALRIDPLEYTCAELKPVQTGGTNEAEQDSGVAGRNCRR